MARGSASILLGAWVVVGVGGCTGNEGTSGVAGSGLGGHVGVGGAKADGTGGMGSGGVNGSGGAANDAGGPANNDATTDAGARTDASSDGGSVSACAAGRFAICEDFEGTAVGTIPSGWGKSPSNTTNVQVASDQAYRGSHSLKMLAQASGARNITKSASALGALAAGHWGRIFYRVQTPAPAPPSNGVIHSTLVSLSGQSPLPVADNVNVRVVDTVVRDFDGKHQFLYNVQPSTRGEFSTQGPYNWSYESRWHCVEWYVSYATQSYRFFFDGAEVTQMAINNGAGKYNGSEIPASFSIAFGWNNYQTVSGNPPAFVAWIDEIAMDANRVGCDN